MTGPRLRLAELCAGYGGIGLGLRLAGWPVDLVWYAEHDPEPKHGNAAAKVMAHHHPGVPNLGDITTVDWSRAGPVDVLAAGYPCQDLSNAGKRAGIEGAKSGIWRNVADAVCQLRPRVVLLENVAAHLARGFGRVLGDLAELGYDAQWMCLRASDLGAPHRRDRVFIVAYPADTDRDALWPEPFPVGACVGTAVVGDDREGPDKLSRLLPTPGARLGDDRRGQPSEGLADQRYASGRRNLDDAVALLPTPTASVAARGGMPAAGREGPNQRGSSGDLMLPSAVMLLPTPTVADSRGSRNATANRAAKPVGVHTNHDGWTLCDVAYADRWVQYGPAIRQWERIVGREAPDPTETGGRGKPVLSSRFVEWMMGLPEGYVTDVLPRNPALRVLGNGLVPAQGAVAYSTLMAVPR